MQRHVIDVVALHERASATPATAVGAEPPRKRQPSRDLASSDLSLAATQVWLARAIMAGRGDDASLESEAAVRLTAGPTLDALERLEIYRRGYHARLIECLADDYPVLQIALGEAVFEALCRAYVANHPSQSPSLNFYGQRMAGFVRSAAPEPLPVRAFASDLAALEWSVVEVVHAASRNPLTLEELGQVPADAWPRARLVPNTALSLLRFDHPVNAYFQDVRDGKAPPIPEASPSATVVYRSGPTVWRMDLTQPMFAALSALVAGEPLGEALERAAVLLGDEDPGAVGQYVTHWFREWISSGLFVGVETG